MIASGPLLRVENLTQHFASGKRVVRAVNSVSFTVSRGETLGVVGESGSGKTTVGRSVLRLYTPTSGRIIFNGVDVTRASRATLSGTLRRKAAMVFQNPSTSLNPQLRIQDTLLEGLVAQGSGSRRQHLGKVAEMLERVGLPAAFGQRFPHELSGGQRQRVGIARALITDPALIVADEPTASLDVSVQAQVVNLLADLQAERNLAYLFISHDLELVQYLSDRILVMYLGRVVESGSTDDLFTQPLHPYTVSLASMHLLPEERVVPKGDPPSPTNPPSGCVFHPRCPIARKRCAVEAPALAEARPGRQVACHFAGELTLPANPANRPAAIPAPLPLSPKTMTTTSRDLI